MRATWKSLSMTARSGERGRGKDILENEDEMDSVVRKMMAARILIAIINSHIQEQRMFGRVSTGGFTAMDEGFAFALQPIKHHQQGKHSTARPELRTASA